MLVTETSSDKKISVLIEADAVKDNDLAIILEENIPKELKTVTVHPFSYVMFEANTLLGADIFIVGESNAEKYIESFVPLQATDEYEYLFLNGVPYGIKIYDHVSKTGSATEYISYGDEDYYLFFGSRSVHLGALNDSKDGYAFDIAKKLIKIK